MTILLILYCSLGGLPPPVFAVIAVLIDFGLLWLVGAL